MPRLNIASRYLLSAIFVIAGISHFINAALYVTAMPPYLPWHLELVYISGVAEIVLGLTLLTRRYTKWAGWGLIALCVAVFPANVHMAMNAELYPSLPVVGLWLRLPAQALLIAWIAWAMRD